MAFINLPSRTVRKPTFAAVINQGHALAQGLIAAFDPARVLSAFEAVAADTTAARFGVSGAGRRFTSSGSLSIQYSHQARFAITGPISIGVVFDVDSLATYTALISKEQSPTVNVPYELRAGSGATDSNFEFMRAHATGYKSFKGTGNRLAAGQTNIRFMVTAPSGIENAPTGYLNGLEFSMGTTGASGGTASGASADNGSSFVLLGTRPDAVTYLNGAMYLVALYSRVLPQAEAIEWTNNPWQIYAPLSRRIYLPAAAGGTTDTALDFDAASTATLTTASIAASDFSASATATATFIGAANGASAITMESAATATFEGAAVAEAEAALSADATSTMILVGAATGSADVSAVSSSTAILVGAGVAAAEISAAASSTAILEGAAVAEGSAALDVAATSTMILETASTAAADLTADGASTMILVGQAVGEVVETPAAPSFGGAGGQRLTKERKRRKREEDAGLALDDEEAIEMIRQMAPVWIRAVRERRLARLGVSARTYH